MYSDEQAKSDEVFNNDTIPLKDFYEIKFIKNRNLLHLDCLNGHLSLLRICKDKAGEAFQTILNETDIDGQSLLHTAAKKGFEQIFKFLIDSNADINQTNSQGQNIVHLLVEHHQSHCLEFILDYLRLNSKLDKIDIDLRSLNGGETALHIAARINNVTAIRILTSFGSCAQIKDSNSNTPLKNALLALASSDDSSNFDSTVKTLIECGAERTLKPSDLKADPVLIGKITECLRKCTTRQLTASNEDATIRNLVFQGGGVKGIAYVGALEEAVRQKVVSLDNIKRVGGTSAGAIAAVLLGLDYPLDELKQMLQQLDFKEFLDSDLKETFLSLKGVESFGVTTVLNNAFSIKKIWDKLNKDYGLFAGDTYRAYIDERIEAKLGKWATFRDLHEQVKRGRPFKYIFLTGTNVSSGECETFSHLHTPDMIIADAARISMSIPVVFAPHKYFIRSPIANERVVHPDKLNQFYVDGGLMNNYPIKLFDSKTSVGHTEYNFVNPETLGFKFMTSTLKANSEVAAKTNEPSEDYFIKFLLANLSFYYNSEENTHAKSVKDHARTVYIDTFEISMLDFDLSEANKQRLMESGSNAVMNYLSRKKANPVEDMPQLSARLYGLLLQIYYGNIEVGNTVQLHKSKIDYDSAIITRVNYEFYSKATQCELEYFKRFQLDLFKRDNKGNTCLHLAVKQLDFECMQRFGNNIQKLNAMSNNTGQLPLDLLHKLEVNVKNNAEKLKIVKIKTFLLANSTS